MGYVCYARNEHVNKEAMVLVPLEQREVNYANYAVSLRGGKLIKQFMGATKGYETVREVSVCQSAAEKFIAENPPRIVATKTVNHEYMLHYISMEALNNAISKNAVIVYEKVREEPKIDENAFSRRIDDEWAKDDE